MSQSKEWYEEAAASENEWVRAVILTPDHVCRSDALSIAQKAQHDAECALGKYHPANAVALQNLGVFYSLIKKDRKKALDYFDQARAIVGLNHPALAETFYWLGKHYNEMNELDAAESCLAESVACDRSGTPPDETRLANALNLLAHARAILYGARAGLPLLTEAYTLYAKVLPKGDPMLLNVLDRLAWLKNEAN